MVAATEQADLAVGPEPLLASALDCLERAKRAIEQAEGRLSEISWAHRQGFPEVVKLTALRCANELEPCLDELAQGYTEVGRLAGPVSYESFRIHKDSEDAFEADEACEHLAKIVDEYNSIRHLWMLTGKAPEPDSPLGELVEIIRRAWLFVERERGR